MVICFHGIIGLVTGKMRIEAFFEGLNVGVEVILVDQIEGRAMRSSVCNERFPLRDYVLRNVNERSFCPSWFFLEELEDELLGVS